jgi:hypothetical protein
MSKQQQGARMAHREPDGIEMLPDGDRIAVWIRGIPMWLDELLTIAADDLTLAAALDKALTEAQARLAATRKREAAKLVSLPSVRDRVAVRGRREGLTT